MGLDVQSRMACASDTICYLSTPRLHYQLRACPSTGTVTRRGREPAWAQGSAGCSSGRKCDAPAAPGWLEPHLAAGCPGAQVPRYTGAAVRCQAVVAFCPGRKDQAEIVDMSGPSRRFLRYKALPPKPPTSGASVIFLRPSLSHSPSIPVPSPPLAHTHTHP